MRMPLGAVIRIQITTLHYKKEKEKKKKEKYNYKLHWSSTFIIVLQQ
jgi:hypothetical protein